MSTKRIFLATLLLLIVILHPTTSLLVPNGLPANVIEDLESNYHSLKSLYQKAVQLKNLLTEEEFSSISKFLDEFSNCVDDYEYQENRSGRLVQNISIKFRSMESTVNDPIFDEQLLKDQAEDLRKLIQKLEEKIDGIKSDPMMFTKEKADDLYERIQELKEKYFHVPESVEEFYAAIESREAKVRQAEQLHRQKQSLEAQIKELKADKQSRDLSFISTEDEIAELNKIIEDIQKQIGELEKPKLENTDNKVFHYLFLVDTSTRGEKSKGILEQIDSNIKALRAARESTKDLFSLITFNSKTQVLAEKLPMNARLQEKDIQSKSQKNYFSDVFEKVRQLLRKSRNKEEIPVVILYIDGMRWYYEPEEIKEEEKTEGWVWEILNAIVNWWRRLFFKEWLLKPIKEIEIQKTKQIFAEFCEENSDRNFIGFVSGTSSKNNEMLKDFAKALNRNERMLQTTIGENYEYFNLAAATEVLPQIFKTLSIAERGPLSQEFVHEQSRIKRQKETEEMKREFYGQDFDKNKLIKDRDSYKENLNELLSKKEKIQPEIKKLADEIEKLESERDSIESQIMSLREEIRFANEKSFQQEQARKDREKLEARYAEVRSHLVVLEQLTKTVQARDHNILAIFEYVVTHSKGFIISLEEALQDSEASDFDSLISFYKDRLQLYGTDLENMEKICQLWLGGSYDQAMTRNLFMMINPRELVTDEIETSKVRQAVEDLQEAKSGRKSLDDLKDEYEDFYLTLRKKVSKSKIEQKVQRMNSRETKIKPLFSPEFKKLMENLDKKIYMMY